MIRRRRKKGKYRGKRFGKVQYRSKPKRSGNLGMIEDVWKTVVRIGVKLLRGGK